MAKALTRSFNQIIAGVCGGLSERFHISVTAVRIVFLLLALFQGLGILIYIVFFFIMPAPHVQLLLGAQRGEELAKLIAASQKPPSIATRLIGVIITLATAAAGLVGFIGSVVGILDYADIHPRNFVSPGLQFIESVMPVAPGATVDVFVHDALAYGQSQEQLRITIGTLTGTFQLDGSRSQSTVRFPLTAGQRYRYSIEGETIVARSGRPVRIFGRGAGELIASPNQHVRVVGNTAATGVVYSLEDCVGSC